MKKISLILVLLLLFQAIPINSFNFAEDLTPEKLVNLTDEKIASLTDQQIITGITSDEDYPLSRSGKLYDNFKLEGTPIRTIDVSLNIDTFRKYKQIVYGNPFNSQDNYEGKILLKSEAKFLGFNNQGDPVTNDLYPGDSGGTEPPDKKWLFDDNEYERSWDQVSEKVAKDQDISELYRHMLTTDTINTDAVGSYTLSEILEKRMGNLTAYLDSPIELREKLESVAQLQMLPTFVSKGIFVMRHNTKGWEQYDTMEWKRLGQLHHSMTIIPEKETVVMLPEDDENLMGSSLSSLHL
ncbi:MAG: hypothetical protein N4A76_00015 [Firmicutes bacterium]|jgi:hypothetical protein|nr:hypothetical protein [Bacillota bacterium]